VPESEKTCDVEWTLEAWLADPSAESAAVRELRDYRRKAAEKLDRVPDDLQSAGRAVMDRLDRFGKGWRLLLESANERGLPLHSVLILEAEGDCTTNLTAVGMGRGQGQRRASMRKLREQRAGQELPEADPEKAGVPLPPLPDENQVEAQAYEGPLLRMTVRTDRLRATRIPKERFAIPEGYRNASETRTPPAPSSGTE
jgi:hypothetical protein